jgi:hypothetical protein
MDRIQHANLKLAPRKCSFFKRKVKFVGHIVSAAGVEIYPDKTEKVTTWPTPTSPEDVRRFLGFVGYYRRFIKNLSQISRPLTDLMPIPTEKKNKGKKKERREWYWGEVQMNAFDTLKRLRTSSPILGYADSTLHMNCIPMHLDLVWELYYTKNNRVRSESFAMPVKELPRLRRTTHPISWSS